MSDDKPTIGDVLAAIVLILLLSSPITIGLWLSYPDPYPTVNIAPATETGDPS